MPANNRETGTEYELKAAEYLAGQGMKIVMFNYRCKIGEIDLIAQDGEYLVFVEVKYRSAKNQGGAMYAISKAKQKTIYRVAEWYMAQYHINRDTFCRFDAVLIDGNEINHIKNAW